VRALPDSLGVLHERDYRLLFGAQAVSLLGDGMVNVALAFAVIDLGGGAPEIGLVFTARALALVLCLLAGGVVGDRLPRRAVLISADLVRMASQGALAAVLIAGEPSFATLAVLSGITGAASGFFNPTSTAFLPAVVSAERLQQANALRGLVSSIGRIGGPSTAGLLVVTVGAGWALAVDAATFAVSAALLSRIRAPGDITRRPKSFLADLRDGWDAFRSRTWLWAFVAWFSFGNLLYGCWAIVGPLVAERDLGGAGPWGLIIAASGVGGVVGGVIALRVRPRRPLVFAVLCVSILFLPLGLLAAGLPAVLIAVGAVVSEIGLVLAITVWESTLQRHVEPAALSRVSSYDWFGSLAFLPLGLAIWGPIADAIGYDSALWLAFGLHVVSVIPLIAVRQIRALPAFPREPVAGAAAQAAAATAAAAGSTSSTDPRPR
jgi:predicted MFS family arabinose efflux permease